MALRLVEKNYQEPEALPEVLPYQCATCGQNFKWGPGCCWWGSWKQLEDGEYIPRFCSADCFATWSRNLKPEQSGRDK